MKESQETCDEHNELVKRYCEDCQVTICLQCAVGLHKGHNIRKIDDAFPQHKEEIVSHSKSLEEKIEMLHDNVENLATMERNVTTIGNKCKEGIQSNTEEMIRILKETQQQQLDEIDMVMLTKNKYLATQRETAEELLMRMKQCNELINKTLQECKPAKILKEKSHIVKKMEECSSIEDIQVFRPVENADIYFQTKYNKLRYSLFHDHAVTIPSTVILHESFATLKVKSTKDSPFVLPASLIRAKVVSLNSNWSKVCNIELINLGEFRLHFMLPNKAAYVLEISIGGVNISGCPFSIPVHHRPESMISNIDNISDLKGPYGIGIFDDNTIVIAENNGNCLTLVDENRINIKPITPIDKTLKSPRGIALTHDQHILVTDNHRILKLKRDGSCVRVFGFQERGNAFSHLDYPIGIAVNPVNGTIYIADSKNNRIQSLRLNLTHPTTFIDDPNRKILNEPSDVAIDNNGNVYVSDYKNNCIKKFSPTSALVLRIGSRGRRPGQLLEPFGIAIRHEQLYVCERGNHRISIFQLSGKFLYSIETNSHQLYTIAINKHGHIYATDYDNGKVMIY